VILNGFALHIYDNVYARRPRSGPTSPLCGRVQGFRLQHILSNIRYCHWRHTRADSEGGRGRIRRNPSTETSRFKMLQTLGKWTGFSEGTRQSTANGDRSDAELAITDASGGRMYRFGGRVLGSAGVAQDSSGGPAPGQILEMCKFTWEGLDAIEITGPPRRELHVADRTLRGRHAQMFI
jgi:hypothetical protein